MDRQTDFLQGCCIRMHWMMIIWGLALLPIMYLLLLFFVFAFTFIVFFFKVLGVCLRALSHV